MVRMRVRTQAAHAAVYAFIVYIPLHGKPNNKTTRSVTHRALLQPYDVAFIETPDYSPPYYCLVVSNTSISAHSQYESPQTMSRLVSFHGLLQLQFFDTLQSRIQVFVEVTSIASDSAFWILFVCDFVDCLFKLLLPCF
jgi:hypothetical protein